MAVAAPRARPRARAIPAPDVSRDRRSTRTKERPKLARTVIWIAVVAALLAGIVAMNIAVLQFRIERGKLQSNIVDLRAENTQIEADISAEAARGRVEAAAGGGLGLVKPDQTTYLKLNRQGR